MAARLIFLRDYTYTPTVERRVSTKYRAGKSPVLVNDDCAAKAIAAGAARLADVEQPAKASRPSRPRPEGVRPRRARVRNG